MISTALTNWLFKPVDIRDYPRGHTRKLEWMPASVPGCVHTDLLANDIIADPFEARYEAGVAWIDERDWIYETSFGWTPNETLPKRVLRFDGLDTVAVISLNGQEIARSDNFFLPLEIDVSDLLVVGSNTVTVLFKSAVLEGERRRREFFDKHSLNWQIGHFSEHAFVRKPGYMSGWDWGPRLVSAGIWAPVRLLQFAARIKSFTVFQQRLEDGRYHVRTETEIEGESSVCVKFGTYESDRDLDIVIEHPELWWPNGYGHPHLYQASAELPTGGRIEKRIGLREIKLVREKDAFGESFDFVVNGEKIWAAGANWIPDDSFPSRVTSEEYSSQIRISKNLNFNMLRVWGGGLYESDPFYDACDLEGILVWQDFTYGCSYYPDEGHAAEVAEAEAAYHVRRLRDRTSLAIWSGNNENLTMWREKWGGANQAPPRYFGEHIYNEVLPKLLAELDPHRPYIPSSPCGSSCDTGDEEPNDGGSGDQHYWDVWHGRGDWKYYADSTGRFASEFGFASSCSRAQWNKVLPPGTPQLADNPTVRWHDKTTKKFAVYRGFVELHYPHSAGLDEWIYTSQLNQRDALQFGIEHYRSGGFCSGALIWQFNDCWPVESWAVQDYLRLLKPAAYELCRLYSANVICVKREEDGWRIRVANHAAAAKEWLVLAQAFSIQGAQEVFSREISVGPGGALLRADELSGQTAIRLRLNGMPESDRWILTCEPKEAKFSEAELQVRGAKEVTLQIKGLSYDTVVCDADDPTNLPIDRLGLKGVQAFTWVNETATLNFGHEPKRLSVRSLHSLRIFEVEPVGARQAGIEPSTFIEI